MLVFDIHNDDTWKLGWAGSVENGLQVQFGIESRFQY